MNTAPENNQQHEQMRESFSRMVARLIATPRGKYVVDWIEKAVLSGFIGVCGLLAGIQWATLDYKGRIDALCRNAASRSSPTPGNNWNRTEGHQPWPTKQ